MGGAQSPWIIRAFLCLSPILWADIGSGKSLDRISTAIKTQESAGVEIIDNYAPRSEFKPYEFRRNDLQIRSAGKQFGELQLAPENSKAQLRTAPTVEVASKTKEANDSAAIRKVLSKVVHSSMDDMLEKLAMSLQEFLARFRKNGDSLDDQQIQSNLRAFQRQNFELQRANMAGISNLGSPEVEKQSQTSQNTFAELLTNTRRLSQGPKQGWREFGSLERPGLSEGNFQLVTPQPTSSRENFYTPKIVEEDLSNPTIWEFLISSILKATDGDKNSGVASTTTAGESVKNSVLASTTDSGKGSTVTSTKDNGKRSMVASTTESLSPVSLTDTENAVFNVTFANILLINESDEKETKHKILPENPIYELQIEPTPSETLEDFVSEFETNPNTKNSTEVDSFGGEDVVNASDPIENGNLESLENSTETEVLSRFNETKTNDYSNFTNSTTQKKGGDWKETVTTDPFEIAASESLASLNGSIDVDFENLTTTVESIIKNSTESRHQSLEIGILLKTMSTGDLGAPDIASPPGSKLVSKTKTEPETIFAKPVSKRPYRLFPKNYTNSAKYLVTGAPTRNSNETERNVRFRTIADRKNQLFIQTILIGSAAGFAVFMFSAFGIVLACYKGRTISEIAPLPTVYVPASGATNLIPNGGAPSAEYLSRGCSAPGFSSGVRGLPRFFGRTLRGKPQASSLGAGGPYYYDTSQSDLSLISTDRQIETYFAAATTVPAANSEAENRRKLEPKNLLERQLSQQLNDSDSPSIMY